LWPGAWIVIVSGISGSASAGALNSIGAGVGLEAGVGGMIGGSLGVGAVLGVGTVVGVGVGNGAPQAASNPLPNRASNRRRL